MRPISCNQEMGTQKGMCAQEAHSLHQSHALFHSLLRISRTSLTVPIIITWVVL